MKDSGARGWFFKIKMDKIFGEYPPGGDPDGTPRLALPLENGAALRYPVGRVEVTG